MGKQYTIKSINRKAIEAIKRPVAIAIKKLAKDNRMSEKLAARVLLNHLQDEFEPVIVLPPLAPKRKRTKGK